ncbi:hypothetical protein FPSE_06389, partial [Fusarium pseudograminearum CS3096]
IKIILKGLNIDISLKYINKTKYYIFLYNNF